MAEPDTSQDAVFAFLSRPDVHGGAAVKRVDTHAASVFLAGERAYKVKRAVRFPFLDYSTLERRRRACEAEPWCRSHARMAALRWAETANPQNGRSR